MLIKLIMIDLLGRIETKEMIETCVLISQRMSPLRTHKYCYITQDYQPRSGTPHNGLGSPTLIFDKKKKLPHRLSHNSVW